MSSFMYLCTIASLLNVLNIASCQPHNQKIPDQSSTKPPAPSLLSELGDLFMHVDETIYKLSQPREQNEDAKQEQTPNYGKRNLRTNYFDQVRQNYEELQKKIQQSFENPANVFSPPEIMNLNFENRGQKSFLDLSLPFLPMNVQLRGKEIKDDLKSKVDGDVSKLPKVASEFSDMSGSINIGGDLYNPRSIQSNPVMGKDMSSSFEFQKRSNPYMERSNPYMERSNLRHRGSSLSNSIDGQEVETENEKQFNSRESDVEGRILGDLLYSEDTFDRHFKRLLRDGKWVVDPKVFFPKEIVENVREITRNQLNNDKDGNEKRKGNKQQLDQNSRTKGNKNKPLKSREASDSGTKSDTLLAFTLNGVPLKLKVNPLHGNPLKHLNRVLTTAGVSLNIPIESHRSLQPAGKDVLQLGSRSDGGQTHATYVDLDDENQLNSLLEALRNFRN